MSDVDDEVCAQVEKMHPDVADFSCEKAPGSFFFLLVIVFRTPFLHAAMNELFDKETIIGLSRALLCES